MKTRIIIASALLFLLPLVSLVPTVAAVTPTLDCSVTKTPTDFSGVSGLTAHSQLVTDTQGRAAWMIWKRIGAADFEAVIFVHDQGCSLSEQDDVNCPEFGAGNDVCVFDAMDWDRLGDLWVINSETHETTPASRNAPPPPGQACTERTGAICGLSWNITAYTNPNATGTVQPLGITTWKNTSTDQGYMIKTDQLDHLANSFTGLALCQPIATGTRLQSNLTGPVGWGLNKIGSTMSVRRHTFNDCSTTHTATLGTDVGGGSFRIQRNDSTELVFVYSGTPTREVKWTADCLQVDLTGCNTYTPDDSQIFDTEARSTDVYDYDVDEAGSALVCGQFESVEGRGFVAKYDLDTKTQDWNITLDLGTATNVFSCQFDHFGGFYTQTIYTEDGVGKQRLSHYTGGGFGSPPPDELIAAIPTATTGPTAFSNTDGAVGFRNFCILTGWESEAGKFFCGLVYVLSGTVLMAAITRDLSKRAVLAIAAATAFGLMIFVTVVELWPTYATVIMIVLSAAVITWAIRKQFIGTDGD